MERIDQPEGSNLCGQACVAMLLGISLEEATGRVKHRGCTNWKMLRRALVAGGLACGEQLYRVTARRQVPDLALCHVRFGRGRVTHWIVMERGMVYDPDPWTARGGGNALSHWGRITSFMEVRR